MVFKQNLITYLLIGFGFFIFFSILGIFFSTSSLEKYHPIKIGRLNITKFEITSLRLEHITSPERNNATTIETFTNIKGHFKELSQGNHQIDFMSISSIEQQQDIGILLKQLQLFEKLNTLKEYSLDLKLKYDDTFHSLLNNIDNLHLSLSTRYSHQQQIIFNVKKVVTILLFIYFLAIFLVATKRKMTREKLLDKSQKNNYLLKEAQKIANLITYSYNFKTKEWDASGSFLDVLGYEMNTNSMQSWVDRIHPKDKLRVANAFSLRLQDSSKKFNETYRVINEVTKEIHWIHHTTQDLKKDSKGNLLPVQGILQDITPHKLAEKKRKRSNTILNKINSLVLVINREGEVTYVSKGIKNILGYTHKDMLGQGWWQHTFSDSKLAQESKDAINQYFFDESLSFMPNEEFSLRRIKTIDDNFKWIKWSFTKESENSIIAIGTDLTELHEKSNRFTTLTEIAHDAIILANDNGEIIEVNKTAREMFGYSKGEILGKSVITLMPKKHGAALIKELDKVNKDGNIKKSKFKISKGLTKEGEVFPVEISFNSWNDNNNQIHCAFIKDITQQKYEEKIKEIIYNITKYAQEKPTFNALLPFIKKNLNSVIDTTNLFVSLYDDDKQNYSSYEEIDLQNGNTVINFSKGESLFDRVIDSKESLFYKKSSKINNTKIKSKCWVGVPLIVKQKVIGVLSVRSYTDENAYSKKDVALLELTASTISQVIQSTKDFEKINLLNQALVQSSAIIIVTNIQNEIEYVNPAFTKITDYKINDVLGKNPETFGVKKINKRASKNLWKAIHKEMSWSGEFTNIKRDGSHFTVLTTVAPVKNDNKTTHYIYVQEDITEIRKLENQFINGFVEAQEIERQSFGEELHDGISQILSAETMYINVLIKENQDRIGGKAKFLTKIKELNLSAANEVRNIAHGLMSNQLMKTGLIKAIENICVDYTNTKDIEFSYLHKNINEDELSKEIKINVFRIIQEITTNIIRHSKATKATITFTKLRSGMLNLIIQDNGIGFNKTDNNINGAGFENIKRRITLLNGTLDISASPNNGVCFTINILP